MSSIDALKKRQQDLEGRVKRLENQRVEPGNNDLDEPNLLHSAFKKEMVQIDSSNIQDFPPEKTIGVIV